MIKHKASEIAKEYKKEIAEIKKRYVSKAKDALDSYLGHIEKKYPNFRAAIVVGCDSDCQIEANYSWEDLWTHIEDKPSFIDLIQLSREWEDEGEDGDGPIWEDGPEIPINKELAFDSKEYIEIIEGFRSFNLKPLYGKNWQILVFKDESGKLKIESGEDYYPCSHTWGHLDDLDG